MTINVTAGSTRRALKIVSWTGRPDLQQLIDNDGDDGTTTVAAEPHDQMDDDIPF
jgi:hypothetical protein